MARTASPLSLHAGRFRVTTLLGGVLFIVALVGVLAWTGTLTQLRGLIPGATVSTPTYQTSTVSRGSVVIGVTATGPISAATNVPLSFKESGKLSALKVNVGDTVAPGQVLATLDTKDLQSLLDQAKATLVESQANLAKIQNGATAQTLAAAQTSVDNAKNSTTEVQASLVTTQATNAQNVQAAQGNVGTAKTSLNSAQATVSSAQDQAAKALAADQITIASDQKIVSTAQTQETQGLAADQTTIANAQKNLDAEKATVAADAPIILQQFQQAKNNLWAAQISRDAACGRDKGGTCSAANASVAAAETAVSTANAQIPYSQKQSAQQIASVQAALDSAQAQLIKDQTSLRAAIVSAQNALAAAQAQMAKDQTTLQGSITAAQNQVKQSAASVAAAQNSVGQAAAQSAASEQAAQAAIANAKNAEQSAAASYNVAAAPALPTDLATAKAQVAIAQGAVDTAQENLDSSSLTAPFAGTIAWVNGSVGQWISGGTVAATTGSVASASAIFTLLDMNNLQVVAQVNEADIGKVAVGNGVTFSVSAFANKTFTGQVLAIQPIGTTVSNVVGYNVTSSVKPIAGATLYPGMTATATIVTAQSDNVLTVPDTAISFAQTALKAGATRATGSAAGSAPSGRPTRSPATADSANAASPSGAPSAQRSRVLTLVGGQLKPVPVTIGLSDGTTTEVVTGLNEGDVVVTGQDTNGAGSAPTAARSTTTTTSPLSTGGPGRRGGGG